MTTHEDASALLTPRESEVLELLRRGLTNADIAGQLGLTVDGVKYHVSMIIAKLGVRNRYEAAHWPERPPWWVGAAAPAGMLATRAARAAAVVVLVGVAGGIGLVALLLARSDGASTPNGASWDNAIAPAPAFFAESARLAGDGWTFESRVSNLGALELVILADDFPQAFSLVDVRTGAVVGSGSVGPQYNVMLVDDPPRLLAIGLDPQNTYRFRMFDLSRAMPSLAADIELPGRVGYQEQFAPAEELSQDGRYLFVPLREWLTTPDCQGPSDARDCTLGSFGIVDVEAGAFAGTAALPPHCGYSWRVMDVGEALPIARCDEQWYAFSADLMGLREVSYPPYALYVTDGGGETRALMESGSVVDEAGRSIATLQPPNEQGLSLSGSAWPIGGGRVVDTFYRKHSTDPVRYLSVIDVRNARVERSLRLPDTTEDVLVLDPARAVVLVESGGGHELRLLDLETMRWAGTVPVPEAPEGPLAIAR